MSSPRITYVPGASAPPEGEVAVLASVYAFVLRGGEARRAEEKKNAAGVTSTDGDDTKGRSADDFLAGTSIRG